MKLNSLSIESIDKYIDERLTKALNLNNQLKLQLLQNSNNNNNNNNNNIIKEEIKLKLTETKSIQCDSDNSHIIPSGRCSSGWPAARSR